MLAPDVEADVAGRHVGPEGDLEDEVVTRNRGREEGKGPGAVVALSTTSSSPASAFSSVVVAVVVVAAARAIIVVVVAA